jgi:glycosyltransferase involved in cell wall biosynthesis
MKYKKLSIVIATYNNSSTIENTLNSIISQEYNDYELLIIDDGSTDSTEDIVKNYLKSDSVLYYKTQNQGVSSARNYGWRHSRGEYLIFIDGDDELKSEYLEKISKCIDNNSPDFVFVGASFFKDGHFKYDVFPSKPYGKYSEEGLFLAGTFIVKKNIFDSFGGYDSNIRYGENTELAIRLTGKPYSKVFIEECLLRVNQTSNRRSTAPGNLIQSISYTIKKHRAYFDQHPLACWGYQQILAVSYFRLGDVTEGRKELWKAWHLRPFKLISLTRLLITYFPLVRRKIYGT